jgi:hypothetical protein
LEITSLPRGRCFECNPDVSEDKNEKYFKEREIFRRRTEEIIKVKRLKL